MAKTKRPGLACLADGGRTPNLGATFGPRYGDKADGEGFDRARKNYERFPKASGSISDRPETLRGALATALAGDSRMSPAKARFVEGLTGSTPAGGGLGVGIADFVPGLGLGLTASDMAQSDAPALDAAIGAGMQAAPFAGPLARAGKAAVTSRAGKAAAGAVAAGAAMSPDDAEASFGGFRRSMAGIGKNFTIREGWDKQLAERGARHIWDDKGLYKGPDGEWRFEIDDSKARVKRLPRPGSEQALDSYIEHPELFEQYPLGGMNVTYDPRPSGMAGYYRPPEYQGYPGSIVVHSRDYAEDPQKFMSLLLHEGQHAIQNMEKFTKGANPEWAVERLMDDIRGGMGGRHGRTSLSPDATDSYHHLADSIDRMPEQWKRQLAYDAYMRNAGEVEARNVQARMGLEPDARRMSMPTDTADVGEGYVIVPGRSPEENLPAYERLIDDLTRRRAMSGGFAEGGAVEADPLDELLALAGAMP